MNLRFSLLRALLVIALMSIHWTSKIACAQNNKEYRSDPVVTSLELPTNFDSHRIATREKMLKDKETTIAEMEGEGCLRHVWFTYANIKERPEQGLGLILRVYCDGETIPYVEVPLSNFFGMHHGHAPAAINSPFLQVTDRGGFNAYFPMPYKNGMKITLENDSPRSIAIWFQAEYQSFTKGSLRETKRFCASYRRANRAESYGRPFHIAHAKGEGAIIGLSLGMRVHDEADHWYHCGGDLMLLDGNTSRAHLISGIGGEDYFGHAWGQSVNSNSSIGTPYYDELPEDTERKPGVPKIAFAAYRFFDKDPIAFHESFYYDFGSLQNDMSSVLYWYQDSKPDRSSKMATWKDRLPETQVDPTNYDLPAEQGLTWHVAGPFSANNRQEFEASAFPEKKIDFSETSPADFGMYATAANLPDGKPTIAKWTQNVPSHFNFVDLTPYFRPRITTNGGLPSEAAAYATTTIEMQEAGVRKFRLGHDDEVRVWLNGKLVCDVEATQGFLTREIELPLQKGKNIILIKAANHSNNNFRAWVFLFALIDDPDSP